MKDSKRIDNKAKSRRIAAYALAGCMAITAAPITMPSEVVKAETPATTYVSITKLLSGSYTISVDSSRLSSSTTYADVASKINVIAIANTANENGSYNKATWAKGAKTVEIYDNAGNLLWDTAGNTSTPGSTKLGNGKTYVIKASFERTIELASGVTTEPTVSGEGFTVSGKIAKNSGIKKVFYPAGGMLKNEKEDATTYWYVKSDGSHDTDKNGLFQNSDGWYRVEAGVAKTTGVKETLEKNSYGTWFIGTNGKVDFTKSGLVTVNNAQDDGEDPNSVNKSASGVADGIYYVENGKVNTNKTGLVQENGKWYNVVKGKVQDDAKAATVAKTPNGKWVYIGENGQSDSDFCGLAKNAYGTWYVKNGIVDFTKEGPVGVNAYGGEETLSDADTVYFLIGGKVQSDKTGILFYEGKPYYVEKGVIGVADFDKKQLAFDSKTSKWYAIDEYGNAASDYSGLVANQYGTWVVEEGVVNFDYNGIADVNEDNAFPGRGEDAVASYYVAGGKVQTDKNGIVLMKSDWGNSNVFNVKAGKLTGLDIDKSAVKASNGKWYVIGKDGFAAGKSLGGNAYGIWMSNESGVIDFKKNGFHVVTEDEAKLSGINEDDIVYIKDGKVQTNVTGLVTVKNDNLGESASTGIATDAKVYVKNGVVCDDADLKEPTVILGSDGIWYCVDETGKVDTTTKIAKNQYGTWYVNNGIVDFNGTGFLTEDGEIYYFVNSKLATDKTGLVRSTPITGGSDTTYYVEKGVVTAKDSKDNLAQLSDGAWYYITDQGTIDLGFTGFAENKYGVWYVEKGRVDFTKTGIVRGVRSASDKIDNLDDSSAIYVVNGKAQLSYSGFVVDGTDKALFEKGQLAQNDDPELYLGTDKKWYYVVNGEVDDDYTGLAKNSYGVWYVYNGVVSFNKTGVVETKAVEAAKLDEGKYYVVKGKMSSDKTGIVKSGATSYYVKKSAVVTGIEADERVVNVDGAWYCINEEGEVFTPDDGLAENSNGVWFIKDGKVDFTKKALLAVDGDNDSPTLTKKEALGKKIYVSGGKFQDDVTCVYVGKDAEGNAEYTYVKKGVETNTDSDITVNTVVKGTDGKNYAVKPGATLSMLENGIARNDDKEVVLVKNYVVDTKTTTTYKVTAGSDATITDVVATKDILIVNGKFAKTTSGIVKVPASSGGYKKINVVKGVCTPADSGNTLVKVDGEYWYVGNTGYEIISIGSTPGLGAFDHDSFYVVGNKVNKKDGIVIIGGTKYTLKAGKVVDSKAIVTGLIKEDSVYKVVVNDVLDKNASGVYTLTTGEPTTGQIAITSTASDLETLNGKKVVVEKGLLKKASSNQAIVVVDNKAYQYADTGYEVAEYSGIYDGKIYDSGELQKAEAGKNKVVSNSGSRYIVNDAGVIQEATGDAYLTVVADDGKYYHIAARTNKVSSYSGLAIINVSGEDKIALFNNGVCDTTATMHKVTSEEATIEGLDENDIIVLESGVFNKDLNKYHKVTSEEATIEGLDENDVIVIKNGKFASSEAEPVQLTEEEATALGLSHTNSTYKYSVTGGKLGNDDLSE